MNNEFSELSQESKIRFAKYNQNFDSLYSLYKDKDSNEDLKNTIMKNKYFYNDYNNKIKYIDLVKSCTNEDELFSFINIKDIDVKNEIYKHPLCSNDLKIIIFCQIKTKEEQIVFLNFASNVIVKLIATNTIFDEVLQFIVNESKYDNSIKDIAKQNKFFNTSLLTNKEENENDENDEDDIKEEDVEFIENKIEDNKPKISIESDILNFIKSSQPKPTLEPKEDIKIDIVEEEVEVIEEIPVEEIILKKIELDSNFINMLDEQKTNTLFEKQLESEENVIIEEEIDYSKIEEVVEIPQIIELIKEENENIEKLRTTTNISDLIFNQYTKKLDEKLAIVNNPLCPLNLLEKFSLDPNLMVKSGIAWNPNVSINILNDFLTIDDVSFLLTLLSSPQLPKPLIRKLSNTENPILKEFVNIKLNSF